jgi:RNA polymerase sigma-70 factor (sigma-E family)
MRVISVDTSIEDKRRSAIAAAKPANASSFDAFYRQEYAGMVAVARALIGDRGRAEDLAQESFITAHRHWDRVAGYDHPRLWVRRVLINRATSLRRRLGTELKAVVKVKAEPGAGVVDDLSAPTSEVWEEVRKLPRRQQQTVVLHYVSGLSMEEIGQTLDCSPGTVKAHLHRARQQLKTTLSDWEEV